MFKPGEKPRWILAVLVVSAYYILMPLYWAADSFARWYERWDADTFGWW